MAPRPARRLALFDIDGTLLVAGDPDHIPCLTEALSEVFGRPIGLDGVQLGGNQERAIAREAARRAGVPTARIDASLDRVMAELGRRFLARVGDRRARLLPGVAAAVAALADAGWDLGLLSGGARVVSEAKVARAGLGRYFPFGAFGDEHEDRAALVPVALSAGTRHHGGEHAPGRTVLIGDTPRDVVAARAAGCGVVAVATGRFGTAELAACRPDAVLSDLSDPEAVVRACDRAISSRSRSGTAPPPSAGGSTR